MKRRIKLTLRYAAITAAFVTLLFLVVLIFSERNREKEFYLMLKSEAVTKANLFLSGLVDAETMQDIYMNNREFLHEVEVAIYDFASRILYNDASEEIDIMRETPEMFAEIVEKEQIEFYYGDYQIVGFLYEFDEEPYILFAAAYDGYGYSKQYALISLIILVWMISMAFFAVLGFVLTKPIDL